MRTAQIQSVQLIRFNFFKFESLIPPLENEPFENLRINRIIY